MGRRFPRSVLLAAFLIAASLVRVVGHAQAETMQFDLVSIHEIVDGVRVLGEFRSAGNRAEYHGFGVPALTAEAWKVRPDQVALSPSVSPNVVYPMMAVGRSARIYDVVALAPEGTAPTRDEFRLMLRFLLATRFRLATHTEKREMSVYVLATNGSSRLKPSSGDSPCRPTASRTPEGQRIVATHCPIQILINDLFVDRPIYDETGLTGFYDFEITAALPFQANDPQAISPFGALNDLGLKLEARRRSVDVLLIDHVERPTPD
jgi:uncharacterized protein (TIGR03435 family)